MKKWAATTLAGALVLSGIGLGNNVMAKENNDTSKPAPAVQTSNNNNKGKISIDSAKKMATGLFKNAKIEEIELEKKNGRLVYHVEFENRKDKEDEVYIDAYTGKVTWEKDFNDDDDDNKQKKDKKNPTNKDNKNNKPSTNKNDDDDNDDKDDDDNKKPAKPKQNKPNKPSAKITKEQAIKIALTKVPGKVEEVELEKENNKLVYEIEIKAKKKKNDDDDAKVYVSATDGKVLKVKWDD